MSQAEQQERISEVLGDKYRILCRIGGGGMAQVYLARHRFHGGLFAVKVLAEHLAQDASIVSRFEWEARMAASLTNHPNIVPIFDIGEGQGLYFLVMQFIAGEDLGGFLRREKRLSLADAANVIAQITEALSCAEAKRIVHRDLKPANMLLDETGRIKLLDFGISKINDASNGLTRPGESMGTPFYMSPEQIRGEVCDIRSDLYSLGVVFYELLTGQRPFENESTSAILMAHLTTAPPSLVSFDPMLASACDPILQKLMAKRPADRYQNTAELLEVFSSYGISTGPGRLRPTVDAGLRHVIDEAELIPLDVHTAATTTASRVSRSNGGGDLASSETNTTAAVVVQVDSPPAELEVPREAVPKSRLPIWIAIAATVLVLAVAGTVLWTHRPATATAPAAAAASQPALPQTLSDSHGTMLLIPAGAFPFGSAADHTEKSVQLPDFYIDQTEVSNAEYRLFCEATGHAAPQTADYATHPDNPVSNVSYDDAVAYAAWAGRRLPTEEEWEKAARGTDGRTFPWGNNPWKEDVPDQVQPVSSDPSRRSPYGAYNMAGNVWEWTGSSYTPNAVDTDGMKRSSKGRSFSAQWRIIKGGSFGLGSSEDFDVTRHRGLPTDAQSPWIGFRCVRTASPV
jgi:serine/threonine protein kinase